MSLAVLQVIHQGGGAGSVSSTLHLSIALRDAGVDVHFVCPPDSPVEALARAAGLQVYPVRLRPRAYRANADLLARELERYPVHLVNSQSSRDRSALALLAYRGQLRVPLVVTRRQMPRTTFVENWLVSRAATRVVAVSRRIADALVRRGTSRRKIAVIPNGLIPSHVDEVPSSEQIDRWRSRIGWEPTRRTIGIVARPKDQAVVLHALHLVQTPVRLVLAGVAPDHSLARLATAVPARHAVVCLPFDPDVRPLYELLEIALLPSRSEGISQAVLEAMALGKPVVVSATGSLLELVRNGVNGRTATARDPAAWAEAIESLLANPAEATALGAAARHTARVEFSLDRTVTRTLALYQTLVAAHD